MAKISFVVAVYQNEGAITRTYEKVRAVFNEHLPSDQYEIIFVDDGSSDGSLQEILAIHHHDPAVKAITFTRNFGQMAAMLAGYKEATGDAVINISADLQDPAELIPEMVEKWRESAEIVICYRINRSDSLAAKFFSKIAYSALRMAIPQIPAGGFDYVLMDRKAVDHFNSTEVRNRFFQGDLLWPGYRTVYIPYTRLKRTIGRSQYNFGKKLKNFIDAFLDASYLPIRYISAAGIFTSAIGILYSINIAISWALGDTPFSGWAPLMIVILLVGGMIMVMLGVIGEYIWRIYDEVRGKPNYVVREKFSKLEDQQ